MGSIPSIVAGSSFGDEASEGKNVTGIAEEDVYKRQMCAGGKLRTEQRLSLPAFACGIQLLPLADIGLGLCRCV